MTEREGWTKIIPDEDLPTFTVGYIRCMTEGCDFGGVYVVGLDDPYRPDYKRHLEESGHDDRFDGCSRPIPLKKLLTAAKGNVA